MFSLVTCKLENAVVMLNFWQLSISHQTTANMHSLSKQNDKINSIHCFFVRKIPTQAIFLIQYKRVAKYKKSREHYLILLTKNQINKLQANSVFTGMILEKFS